MAGGARKETAFRTLLMESPRKETTEERKKRRKAIVRLPHGQIKKERKKTGKHISRTELNKKQF